MKLGNPIFKSKKVHLWIRKDHFKDNLGVRDWIENVVRKKILFTYPPLMCIYYIFRSTAGGGPFLSPKILTIFFINCELRI